MYFPCSSNSYGPQFIHKVAVCEHRGLQISQPTLPTVNDRQTTTHKMRRQKQQKYTNEKQVVNWARIADYQYLKHFFTNTPQKQYFKNDVGMCYTHNDWFCTRTLGESTAIFCWFATLTDSSRSDNWKYVKIFITVSVWTMTWFIMIHSNDKPLH